MIPPEYDSMIAKIIAAGRDRDEALGRLHRALAQMTVLVRGGTTNKSFLIDLLGRPEVIAGQIDTAWLDRLTAAGEHLPTLHADVGLVAAALDADQLQAGEDQATFLGWANRGRPQAASTSAARSNCATARSPTWSGSDRSDRPGSRSRSTASRHSSTSSGWEGRAAG